MGAVRMFIICQCLIGFADLAGSCTWVFRLCGHFIIEEVKQLVYFVKA